LYYSPGMVMFEVVAIAQWGKQARRKAGAQFL